MKNPAGLMVGLVVLSGAPAAAMPQQSENIVVVTPAVPPGYAYMQPFAYPAGGQDDAQQQRTTKLTVPDETPSVRLRRNCGYRFHPLTISPFRHFRSSRELDRPARTSLG